MKRVWLGTLALAAIIPIGVANAKTYRGEEGRREGARFSERDDRLERGRRSEDSARTFREDGGRTFRSGTAAGTGEGASGWSSHWWGGGEPSGHGEEEGMSPRDLIRSGVQQFVQRMDRNRDGYLARDEVPESLRAGFDQVDRNHDGYLSASELRQQALTAAARRAPVLFTGLWIIDAERGQIDVDDLQQAYDIMQRLDENQDGKITRDELRDKAREVAARIVDRCFQKLDQNEDDQISRSEASGSPLAQRFQELDENRDNQLTRNEIRDALENSQVASRLRERFESRRGESERR